MALITCPECKKEISDQAKACPHCGYPIENATPIVDASEASSAPASKDELSNQAEPLSVENATSSPKAFSSKKILGIALALAAAIGLFIYLNGAKVTASNLNTDAFYSSDLGIGVRLGQSKSQVDKLLGAPALQYDSYIYEGYLSVTYENGKVDTLAIEYPNERWETYGGINIDSTAEDLVRILGEPTQKLENDKKWFYQRKNHAIGFSVRSNGLNYIYIYDLHGQRLLTQDEIDSMEQ